jgi:TolB-like protein/Tfp pilus assembly protein PilF
LKRKAGSIWAALAIVAGLVTMLAVWQLGPRHSPLPEMASIVVLPFIDLTAGKSEQTFCDGLTEETSNWLAQIPTLRVVARTSAFAYRGRSEDVRTIGRELHTSHVLEGSLRRSGDRMRITVQLIDTNTGFHLWSDSYNVEAGDVLHVQEDVARQVAGNLEIRITAETDSRFEGRRSKNAQAQEMYLNAKAHALKFDNASNELAITLYREALKADPSFALAKVWLAQAISNRQYFTSQRMEDLLPQILPLLAEAEKAAPQLVDLYVVRGAVYTGLRQREIAIRDLKRALEMSPNTTQAASMLGYYYLTGGEPRDALTYYTMASALDLRDFGWHAYRCMALTDLGQFDEAEKACDLARSLGPSSPWVYSVSSSLEAARGRLDEAVRYSEKALERDDDIAEIHAARGRWLMRLELMKEAGEVVRQAVSASPEGARRNVPLLMVGAAAAIDTGGAAGLKSFVKEFALEESNDPSLLFELANAYLAVDQPREARACVDRALASGSLTAEDLASPWRVRTGTSYLLIGAVALRATGDNAAAERRLEQLDALLARTADAGMRTSGMFELKAQLAAQQGRPDAAIASLQQAVQLGWDGVWQAEHEPYFDSLRGRQDFEAVLAAARARNASAAAKLRNRLLPPAADDESGRPGGGKAL